MSKNEIIFKGLFKRSIGWFVFALIFLILGIFAIMDIGGAGIWLILFGIFFALLGSIIAFPKIVIISEEGIKIPNLRGGIFIPWSNVDRFGFFDYHAYRSYHLTIGIFLIDNTGVKGQGAASAFLNRMLHGKKEVPAYMIDNHGKRRSDYDEIMKALKKFHGEYKRKSS